MKGNKLTLTVTVPANTTALVHLPGKKLLSVADGSKPLIQKNVVTELGTADGRLLVEIGSGNYVFTCE